MFTETNVTQSLKKSRLWRKIQHFKFDADDAVITFAGKLAAQNNWSARFTDSAIEEYRRFVFLCCVSPTGASPSPVVDKVWHQHLTYTQSYWTALCRDTLGRDLHHHPTKGGEEEKRKHQNWYKETLSLYVQVFEVAPPADIWPQPDDVPYKFNDLNNLSHFANKVIKFVFYCVGIFSLIAVSLDYFPFNLAGPQFLVFYGLLCTATAIIFDALNKHQNSKMHAFIQNNFPNDVNIFQLALFIRGVKGLIQTSVLNLVQAGALTIKEDGEFTVNNKVQLAVAQNPYAESFYCEAEGNKLSYKEIKRNWRINGDYAHPGLAWISKMVEYRSLQKTWLPAAVLSVGFIRLVQGAMNNRPVVLLILEMVLFFIAVAWMNEMCRFYQTTQEMTHTIYCEKLETSGQVHNKTITNFTLYGSFVLSDFAEREQLSKIFYTDNFSNGGGGDSNGGGGGGEGGGGDGGGNSCCSGCGGCGGG